MVLVWFGLVWVLFGFGIDEAIRPSVFLFFFFSFLGVEVGERFVERGRRSCRRGFSAKVIFHFHGWVVVFSPRLYAEVLS